MPRKRRFRDHLVFAYILDDSDVPLITFCGLDLTKHKEHLAVEDEIDSSPEAMCGNCVRTKKYKRRS